MRVRSPESSGVWPDRRRLSPEELVADPRAGSGAVAAAASAAQRLELDGSVVLGVDAEHDLVVLRLLTEAASYLVDLDWTLAGRPPWPVRTVVHLPPPGDTVGTAAREFADQWRARHRVALCTYRNGPGFVRIRDLRPDGQRSRVLIRGVWAEVFAALAAGIADTSDEHVERLLGDLTEAGLAVRLAAGHQLLPVRPLRWPIPYSVV